MECAAREVVPLKPKTRKQESIACY
jgi:hypothetical protein